MFNILLFSFICSNFMVQEFSHCLICLQATLGSGASTKKSILQCEVGDRKPIYLCTLLPDRLETCPLNLEFEEDDKVTFSIIGPQSVHLSGFFYEDGYGWYPFSVVAKLIKLHVFGGMTIIS